MTLLVCKISLIMGFSLLKGHLVESSKWGQIAQICNERVLMEVEGWGMEMLIKNLELFIAF